MQSSPAFALSSLVALLAAGVSVAGEIRVPADHATIQTAINVAGPGDVVLVSPGRYVERIALRPHVTVRSVGDEARGELGPKRAEVTILDGGGDGEDPGVTMAEGATLDGLTVTNVGTYDDDRWNADWETHGENQKHEHIGHFGTPGVAINGVNCRVVHCIVHHNGHTGIAIRGRDGRDCSPVVAHNVTHRNMGGGIGSMNGSTATIEHNVCFENLYAGIGHDGAHPIVRHNVCHRNIRAGIGISEGARPVVRDNVCHHNRRAGIGIRSGEGTQPVVERNECHANEMAGVGTEDEAQPIVRGNRCHHNRLAGIGSRGHASPIVVGNECWANDAAGIGIEGGARPTIVRNTSRENAKAGIGVRGEGTRAVLVDNRCIENRLVAIGLPDEATAIVVGNHLERTGGMPPMVAVLGTSRAMLVDNTVRGGGVAGVLVAGRATFSGNTLRGSGRGSGVWGRPGARIWVEGDRIEGFGTAINTSGAEVSVVDARVDAAKGPAIVVRKPSSPTVVRETTIVTSRPLTESIVTEEPLGYVGGNSAVPREATENGADGEAETP